MKKWIVYMDRDSADEEAVQCGLFDSEEEARMVYEQFKAEAMEYVDDTGFTGDERVHIARIIHSLLPVTVYSKDYKSYSFEWEEFE